MNRNFALLRTVIAAILISGCSAGSSQTVRSFLAVYRPLSPSEGVAASSFHLLVNGPDTDEARKAVMVLNPSTVFLRYLTMNSVRANHSAWEDDVLQHHPDYLLRTIQGDRNPDLPLREKYVWGYLSPFDSSKSSRDSYVLDPRSEGWASLYGHHAAREMASIKAPVRKGVFVDNVWPFYVYFFRQLPSRLHVDLTGDGVMDERDDHAWADATIRFSRRVRDSVGAEDLLIANFGTRWAHGSPGFRILAQGAFDGAMNEEFAHATLATDPASYPSLKLWKDDVESLRLADSLGKIALAQSAGAEDDHAARMFCLASFLLGAGRSSLYSYRFRVGYDVLYHMPETSVDLGKPVESFATLEDLRDPTSRLYRRRYERGWVAVNMTKDTLRVPIAEGEELLALDGGTMEDGGRVRWVTQDTATIPPSAGLVVRRP